MTILKGKQPMIGTLQERLERTLDEAVELAQIGGHSIPASKIAARVYDSEPELVKEVARSIIIERFTWLILRRRRDRWKNRLPDQMTLPDPIFQGLPRTILLRNGERPRLDTATLSETENHLKMLRERLKTSLSSDPVRSSRRASSEMGWSG